MIPIEEQIKCVEREIALRERVYPKFIRNSGMKPAKADYEIKAMRAVLETLERLKEISKDFRNP